MFANLATGSWAGPIELRAHSLFQAVTGSDPTDEAEAWDRYFETTQFVYGTQPARIVIEALAHIKGGRALDLAMGEGRNAIYLAQAGFQVEGIDISPNAILKAQRRARELGVEIQTKIEDLSQTRLGKQKYDIILNVDFFEEKLLKQIPSALKTGGLLVLEVDHYQGGSGPRDFAANSGQIREAFSTLTWLNYREVDLGDSSHKIQLIAVKP